MDLTFASNFLRVTRSHCQLPAGLVINSIIKYHTLPVVVVVVIKVLAGEKAKASLKPKMWVTEYQNRSWVMIFDRNYIFPCCGSLAHDYIYSPRILETRQVSNLQYVDMYRYLYCTQYAQILLTRAKLNQKINILWLTFLEI